MHATHPWAPAYSCRRGPAVLVALAVAALLAGFANAGLASPISYNAVTEFNGVQGGSTGVWSYGRLDGAGGSFSPAAFYDGANFRGPGAGDFPYVGAGYMHPGCADAGGNTCVGDAAFANLRFTAPTAGTYTATFRVRLSDPGNNPFTCNGCQIATGGFPDYRRDGVRAWLNGAFLDLPTWEPATLPQSFEFKTLVQTFALAAGGTIDFAVDHNGARTCLTCVPVTRFNLYDSTNFEATVALVPVPAAAWLFGSALAAVAWFRRR
jgi:hypothetical protein